jgi:antitoxin component of MazEF toxin-antitoxin module
MMEKGLEYRKIQRVGKGSYVVSLPKDWVRDLGLKKGETLALEVQEDSSILLLPSKILEGRKEDEQSYRKEYRIGVDPRDDAQSVCRRITSLYVISADLIHVHFREGRVPPEHKAAINHLSKNLLLGSEIISETSNSKGHSKNDHPSLVGEQRCHLVAGAD